MFPILSRLIGVRLLEEGVGPIMYLMGSASAEGISGKFCEFGYKYRSHQLWKPTALHIHPSEGFAIAPSTADEQLCRKFYEDTEVVIKKLKAKY